MPDASTYPQFETVSRYDRARAVTQDARRMMVQVEGELVHALATRFDCTSPIYRRSKRNEVRLCCRQLRRFRGEYRAAFRAFAAGGVA